jgi:hypothetical protein
MSNISEVNFADFKLRKKENFVCSIYLFGLKRYGNFPTVKSIEHLRKWAESLKRCNITGILFHNCFDKYELNSFADLPIKFVHVSPSKRHMSGLYRFELYYSFLKNYSSYIDNVFFTDSTDLDILKNPFESQIYRSDKIYIGYEPVIAGNKWMIGASRGFKEYIELLRSDQEFYHRPLLNAGCIGGSHKEVLPFIKRTTELCQRMYPISSTQDMPIINYLAYKEFKDKVEYGKHVNTIFTAYEQNNNVAWIRHK